MEYAVLLVLTLLCYAWLGNRERINWERINWERIRRLAPLRHLHVTKWHRRV